MYTMTGRFRSLKSQVWAYSCFFSKLLQTGKLLDISMDSG